MRSVPSEYLPIDHIPELGAAANNFWRDVSSRSAMEEKLQAYFRPKTCEYDNSALESAWQDVECLVNKTVAQGSLTSVSLSDAFAALPSDTSPGLPYSMAGANTKAKVRGHLIKDAIKARHLLLCGKNPAVFPCVAASRRVVRKVGENKPRLVWAYPGSQLCLEGQFAVPLTHALRGAEWIGWSVNWMDCGRWRETLQPPIGQEAGAVVSVDFSNFDANVLAALVRRAFSILERLFTFSEGEARVWKHIVDYFIDTPILFYGKVYQKHRGIPSGSYFTQVVGTLVNMAYTYYVHHAQPIVKLIVKGAKWLGDDSRFFIREARAKDEFQEIWINRYSDLGAIASATKSFYEIICAESSLGSFLSRKVLRGYPHLYFDYEKFVGQLVIPEDNDAGPEFALGRIVGLTWAYGYNKRAYALLSLCYGYVSRTYGVSTPFLKPRFLRELKYQVNAEGIDFTRMPSYKELTLRYFGYV